MRHLTSFTATLIVAIPFCVYSYKVQRIHSPDSVFRFSCVGATGISQKFFCKEYEQKGSTMVLYPTKKDRSIRTLLTLDNYLSISIDKVATGVHTEAPKLFPEDKGLASGEAQKGKKNLASSLSD